MQLYSADATTFKKKKNAYKNFKKLPSKVAYLWQFGFFFPENLQKLRVES